MLGLVIALLRLGLEAAFEVTAVFLVVLEALFEKSDLLLKVLDLGLVGVDLLALDAEALNRFVFELQLLPQLLDLEDLALDEFNGFLLSLVDRGLEGGVLPLEKVLLHFKI